MAIINSMEEIKEAVPKKRKLDSDLNPKLKQKKQKKAKVSVNEEKCDTEIVDNPVENTTIQAKPLSAEELAQRYPVLNDQELVKRFMAVPMNNNQKGRIRQALRQGVKGANDELLPDVIYGKMQAITKLKEQTESDLRKLRILYNMLSQSTKAGNVENKEKKKNKNKKAGKKDKQSDKKVDTVSKESAVEESVDKEKNNNSAEEVTDKKEKVKGPKRYVVFVGNLTPDVEKEKVLSHFSELSDHIVDVRIPKREEGKKSSIAYIELKDEHSYERALSKHHTMLDNKRINVLYTTQKNSKISKSEAKSTAAKLIALQKSGKLIGSVAQNKKRTFRRNRAKRAIAKAAAASA